MKKDIEKLLTENRDQLDVETPPHEAWDNIREGWKATKVTKKPRNYQLWWKVAAAVLLVTSISLIIRNVSLKQQVEELASLGDLSEEYRTMENGYQLEIGQLSSQLPLEDLSTADDFAWMFEELKTLEDINLQYRKDIGKEVDQERLVRALVDYYEKKIRLLKKLELEIKRQENEKNNNTSISAI